MIAVKHSFLFILLSSIKVARVISFSKPTFCLTNAIVNLTGNPTDSSGSVNKSGDIFPPEAVWVENDETFGCPCYFKRCLQFCCPLGHSLNKERCVEDDFTPIILLSGEKKIDVTGYPFTAVLQCDTANLIEDLYWIDEYYVIHEDIGFIHLTDFDREFGIGKYCFFREPDSLIYAVRTCFDFEDEKSTNLSLVCANISMIFSLLTFIVYTVIPELKSFQGCMFRCYLASYIGYIFLITMSNLLMRNFISTTSNWILMIVIGVGSYYFSIACMCWLTAMSFDVWRKFRSLRPCPVDDRLRNSKTLTLICYSIFAWGGPVLPTLSVWLVFFYNPTDVSADSIRLYFIILPAFGMAVCNTCLYILTATKISMLKKETANVIDGANKHHRENEQWFNLYVKLFMMMGGYLLISVIFMSWSNPIFQVVGNLFQALNGILLFLICVWKDNVKLLIRKRSHEILRSLSMSFRRNSSQTTAVLQNSATFISSINNNNNE